MIQKLVNLVNPSGLIVQTISQFSLRPTFLRKVRGLRKAQRFFPLEEKGNYCKELQNI